MKKIFIGFAALLVLIILLSAGVALLWDRGGLSIGEKIAVVYIEGPIISSKRVIEELKDYEEDDSVKALVLRVNSPGGGVAPSQEIFRVVKRISEQKHVVTSMGALAASGGYYISAPSSVIVANPGTLTGSIGVIMEIPNIENLMDKIGIKTQVIKSGELKDMGSSFRKMSKKDREVLQGIIDDVYEQFITDVAEMRSMDLEDVRVLADGRILTGSQALKAGLVDKMGGLDDAIDVAAELAGIEGEPNVVTKKDDKNIIDLLTGELAGKISTIFPHIKINYMISP
jgi:protease-4